MRCSSLLLGLTAFYMASAIPTPADSLTVSTDPALQNFLTNNLQCESSEDLVSAQDPYVNVLLEEVGLPSRGDDLSSLVQGEDRDIFISGAFSIAAYRRPVAGDSVFRDLACGLNACKRDDGRIAIGCHPACGNGDYYVCLRRK